MREIFKLLCTSKNLAYNWFIIVAGMIFGATTAYILLAFFPFSMLPKDITHYQNYLFLTQALFPNNRIVTYVVAIALIFMIAGLYYLFFISICYASRFIRKRLRNDDIVTESFRISIIFSCILSMLLLSLVVTSISKSREFPENIHSAISANAMGKIHVLDVNPDREKKQIRYTNDHLDTWKNTNVNSCYNKDHYVISTLVASGYFYRIVTFKSGKKYKISVDVKDGTARSSEFQLIWNDGSGWNMSPTKTTTRNLTTHTFYIEQPKSSTGGSVGVYIPNSLEGKSIELKNFCFAELSSESVDSDECDKRFEIISNGIDNKLMPNFRNGLFIADFKIDKGFWFVYLRENRTKPKSNYILKISKKELSWNTLINGKPVEFANNVVGNIFSCVRPYTYKPSEWNRLVVWSLENFFQVWVNGIPIIKMEDTAAHRKGSLFIAKGPSVELREARIIVQEEKYLGYIVYLLVYLLCVILFTFCVTYLPLKPIHEKNKFSIWPIIYNRLFYIISLTRAIIAETVASLFWILSIFTAVHLIVSLLLIPGKFYLMVYTIYALPFMIVITTRYRKYINKITNQYGLFTFPFLIGALYIVSCFMRKSAKFNFIWIFICCSLLITGVYAYYKVYHRSTDYMCKINQIFLKSTPIFWMALISAVYCSSELEAMPVIKYFQTHLLSPMNFISHGMFPGSDSYQHLGIGFFYLIYWVIKILQQDATVDIMQRIYWFATLFSFTTWAIYMRIITKSYVIAFLGLLIYLTYTRIGLESHNHFVRSFLLTPTLLCSIFFFHKKEKSAFIIFAGFLTGYLVLHDNLTGIIHFVAMLAYITFYILYMSYSKTIAKNRISSLLITVTSTILAMLLPIMAFLLLYGYSGKLVSFLNNNSALSLGNFPIWSHYYQKLNFYPTSFSGVFYSLGQAELIVLVLYLICFSMLLNRFITRRLTAEDFSIFFLMLLGFGFYTYHLVIVDHPVEFRIAIIPYVPILAYLLKQLLIKCIKVIENNWHDRASHFIIITSIVILFISIFNPCWVVFQISQDTKMRITQGFPIYIATAMNAKPFFLKPLESYGGILHKISINNKFLKTPKDVYANIPHRINWRNSVVINFGNYTEIMKYDHLVEMYHDIRNLIFNKKPVFIISNHGQILYYLFNILPPFRTIFNQTSWTKQNYKEVIEAFRKHNPSIVIVQKGFIGSVDFGGLFHEINFKQNYQKIKQYPCFELYKRVLKL